MHPRQRNALPACVVSSLVLSTGLLVFAATDLNSVRPHAEEKIFKGSPPRRAVTSDLHACRGEISVVETAPETRRRGPSANFTQLWSDAERNARQPAHPYVERRHAAAIYLYTKSRDPPAEPLRSDRQPLYSPLSEALQVLKHSQVMCLHTSYRTERRLNISAGHVRFRSFLLGEDGRDVNRSASCLEIKTCFGADVTYYSTRDLRGQVLIPPYEVFGVTGVHADRAGCTVAYTLQSNLDCVYDTNSKRIYSISPSPAFPLWPVLVAGGAMTASLLLIFVVAKLLERRKEAAVRVVVLHGSTYFHARIQK